MAPRNKYQRRGFGLRHLEWTARIGEGNLPRRPREMMPNERRTDRQRTDTGFCEVGESERDTHRRDDRQGVVRVRVSVSEGSRMIITKRVGINE